MNPVFSRHDFKSGIGYKLSRAAKILQTTVDLALEDVGLTRLSWTILASVAFDGKSTATEIAKHVGIDRTAVSRMISRIEKDGFLRRTKSTSDRRAHKLIVTEKGAELSQLVPRVVQNALEPHLLDLSPNQIRKLGELLDAIQSGEQVVWTE